MDSNSEYELYLIKRELQNIIDELDTIANGIRYDFKGIGNEKCAAALKNARDYYTDIKIKLEKMDLSSLTDEFIAAKQEERKAQAALAAEQARASASALQSNKSSGEFPITGVQNNNSNKSANRSFASIVKEALPWLFR